MSFTKVEVPGEKKGKKVSIRPYFEGGENMGLENYGMTMHEGAVHTEQLACIENNGIKRYITGLNEFAPDIKLIKDPEEKAAKIKEIRTIVAQLERDLAGNPVKADAENFWDQVTLLRPNNDEFWDKVDLSAGSTVVFLDPTNDPYDLIKIRAIDAGGFTMVAKSLAAAKDMATPPKFYLDRHEETINTKNTLRKLQNKAAVALENLYNTDANKLLYITKVIDPGSPQFKKNTSNDALYEAMDDYIKGLSFEKVQKRAANNFINLSEQSIGDLKLRAIIKDAMYYKTLTPKADGYIYHTDTATNVGRNSADIVEFMKNPMNEDITDSIILTIETEWNK